MTNKEIIDEAYEIAQIYEDTSEYQDEHIRIITALRKAADRIKELEAILIKENK